MSIDKTIICPAHRVLRKEGGLKFGRMIVIEIFKTTINCECLAQRVGKIITEKFKNIIVNFDLEDCDKILRIEEDIVPVMEIKSTIESLGLKCEVLE